MSKYHTSLPTHSDLAPSCRPMLAALACLNLAAVGAIAMLIRRRRSQKRSLSSQINDASIYGTA